MARNIEELKKVQLESLFNSMKMYHDTRKATEKKMREDKNADGTNRFGEDDIKKQLDAIDEGRDSVIEQYQYLGGDINTILAEVKRLDEEDEAKDKKKKKKLSISLDALKPNAKGNGNVKDKLNKAQEIEKKKEEIKVVSEQKPVVTDSTTAETKPAPKFIDKVSFIPKSYQYDPTQEFDTIPLPSKGQCYSGKCSTIGVSPLNGYDENLMVSPNLYKEGILIDAILKRKVMSDIDINDLLDGDRDAIVLWLRATGYGNEYPVTVKDPDSGQEFDSVVDLSDVNFKPFKLVGDENGWFDFTLPVSHDNIKFKFLTHRDKEELSMIGKMENTLLMKGEILTMAKQIDNFIEVNTDIDEDTEKKLKVASQNIQDATENMDVTDALSYTESLTNRMEYAIVSVNGNTDKNFISEYVKRMPVRDSFALRTYMTENEPGVDFNFNVEKPESLGGGSVPVFLQVNQFVFLNISR